jgi:hypothetical protein
MRRRPIVTFRPDLERFEEKRLLSAGRAAAHAAALRSGAAGEFARAAASHSAPLAPTGYIAYRITNPTGRPVHLVPPFLLVPVQAAKPVPGQIYNVTYVVIRNGTAHTFTAADNLRIRIPGNSGTKRPVRGNAFPVLTGNEVWKPKTWVVFYILGKTYYPLSPQVSAGFELQAGGRMSTMVPGPSGIIAHIPYDPATFAKVLTFNVAYGQGAQLGPGAAAGMGDTALNVLVNAKSQRMDYAGHF